MSGMLTQYCAEASGPSLRDPRSSAASELTIGCRCAATQPVRRSPIAIVPPRSAAAAGPNASTATSPSRAALGMYHAPVMRGVMSTSSCEQSARTSATRASPDATRARLTNASTPADAAVSRPGSAGGGGSGWRDCVIFCSTSRCSVVSAPATLMSRYTRMNMSTTCGSYIRPRRSSRISIAASSVILRRYGRSEVSASKQSTTDRIRAPSGMSLPRMPRG